MYHGFDLIDQFQAMAKKDSSFINWNGHFATGKKKRLPKKYHDHLVQNLAMQHVLVKGEDLKNLVTAIKKKKPLAKPIALRDSVSLRCNECGENLNFETDGFKWVCKTPCEFPDGLPPTVWELNVPSGRLIVTNCLTDEFPVQGDYDIGTKMGTRQTILAYAEAGMACSYVGNTCPGVYHCGDSHYVIGSTGSRNKNPRWPGSTFSKIVARVSTSWWWYSICDYDELARRIDAIDKESFDIVKCKPGVYEFKDLYQFADRDNYKDPQIFAAFKWVRKPDPIRNYRLSYDSLNVNAEQVVADSIRKWPSLYGDGKTAASIQKAVDHLMVVNGGGSHYHPNGFWSYGPELNNDSPSIEIPIFDARYHWYPICGYSTIAQIAGENEGLPIVRGEEVVKVNDSFLALAFNVLRCMVVHGVHYSDDATEQKQREEHANKLIRKCMDAIKAKYPDKIPDNCKDI